MRIAVIGTGAIGGTVAALADRAGHELTVTARGPQLEVLRQHGVHLTGAWGEHTAHPAVLEVLTESPDRPDLAVLAVKAQDAETALAANAAALDGVPLVVIQNGLGGAEGAAAHLPSTPVVGGLALFAASYLSPGEVTITAAATTYLGSVSADVETFDLVHRTVGTFLPVEIAADFAAAQWTKLIVNQVNALPAITGLSVQQTVADPVLRRLLTRSMREAVAVARARGVRFPALLGLDDRLLRLFAAAPLPLAELLPRLMARRMGATPNPGSTLQSIRRGQLTEIDHLNGAVVAEAARATPPVAAPLNAALTALVHRVEREGRFLTSSEVAAATAN